MLSARKKVANIYMGQLQGQIHAEKQFGYVMVLHTKRNLIMQPRLVVHRQKRSLVNPKRIVVISNHLKPVKALHLYWEARNIKIALSVFVPYK